MLRVAVVAGPGKQTDTGLHEVLTCYRIPANYRRCRSLKNQLSWHNKYHRRSNLHRHEPARGGRLRFLPGQLDAGALTRQPRHERKSNRDCSPLPRGRGHHGWLRPLPNCYLQAPAR